MLIEEVLEDGTIETLTPLTPLGDATITCVHEKHVEKHSGANRQPLRLEFKGHIPHAIHRQPLPPAPLLVSLDAPRSTALLACSRNATRSAAGTTHKRSRARQQHADADDMSLTDMDLLDLNLDAEEERSSGGGSSKRVRTTQPSPQSVVHLELERKRAAAVDEASDDDDDDDGVQRQRKRHTSRRSAALRPPADSSPSALPPQAAAPKPPLVGQPHGGERRGKRRLDETELASVGNLFKDLRVHHDGATWSYHDRMLLKMPRTISSCA